MKNKIIFLALLFSLFVYADDQAGSIGSGGGGGGSDTGAIARDGSRPPTADQPWGGFIISGYGTPSDPDDLIDISYGDDNYLKLDGSNGPMQGDLDFGLFSITQLLEAHIDDGSYSAKFYVNSGINPDGTFTNAVDLLNSSLVSIDDGFAVEGAVFAQERIVSPVINTAIVTNFVSDGTDLDGEDIEYSNTSGTGAGAPASHIFKTGTQGVSGTDPHVVEDRFEISELGANFYLHDVFNVGSLEFDDGSNSWLVEPTVNGLDFAGAELEDLADPTSAQSAATKNYIDTHAADTSTHGVTGDIVGTTDTQSLSAKTIPVGTNTISSTASRAAQFGAGGALEASGVTSTELGYSSGVTSSIQTQINGKLPTSGAGLVEQICGHLESPANKSYWLIQSSSYSLTVNSITAICDSGTVSAQLENDAGTALTGCATADNPWSSVEDSSTCTANNTISSGHNLELVLSSVAAADDCRFCVQTTRN